MLLLLLPPLLLPPPPPPLLLLPLLLLLPVGRSMPVAVGETRWDVRVSRDRSGASSTTRTPSRSATWRERE